MLSSISNITAQAKILQSTTQGVDIPPRHFPTSPSTDGTTPASSNSSHESIAGLYTEAQLHTTFEVHPNDAPLVDKSELGKFRFARKVERFNTIDTTMTHALATATLAASPTINQTVSDGLQAIRELEALETVTVEVDGHDQELGIEDQAGNSYARQAFEALKSKAEDAQAFLERADTAKTEFMDWKARQADGSTTTTDKLQRHIFGKEMHAVFLRSLAQSVVVVGFAAGMQAATGAMIKSYFENDPDAIPPGLLDQAKEDLSKDATQEEIQAKAIELLSKPGSTYLDANTASTLGIYGSEVGVGLVRGVLVPIADSQNEMDIRKHKVSSSTETGSPAAITGGEKTANQRFLESFNRSLRPQIKANIQSGALAATVGLGLGGSKSGIKAAVDIGKSMGFGVVAGTSNAAADGFRSAVYTGGNETITQGIKVGGRVVGRAVAQMGKLAMSYGQSAIEGKMDIRSINEDAIKAIGIQVGLSGTVKEVIGAAVQRMTSGNLPPNDRSVLASADALVAIKELMIELADTSNPAVQALGEGTRVALLQEFTTTLANAYTANNISFADDDFDGAYDAYETERTGRSPLAHTDEIV